MVFHSINPIDTVLYLSLLAPHAFMGPLVYGCLLVALSFFRLDKWWHMLPSGVFLAVVEARFCVIFCIFYRSHSHYAPPCGQRLLDL